VGRSALPQRRVVARPSSFPTIAEWVEGRRGGLALLQRRVVARPSPFPTFAEWGEGWRGRLALLQRRVAASLPFTDTRLSSLVPPPQLRATLPTRVPGSQRGGSHGQRPKTPRTNHAVRSHLQTTSLSSAYGVS
jgi:hypothetical protein